MVWYGSYAKWFSSVYHHFSVLISIYMCLLITSASNTLLGKCWDINVDKNRMQSFGDELCLPITVL